MSEFILVTSSALDAALVSGGFSSDGVLPKEGNIARIKLSDKVIGYRIANEPDYPFFALITVKYLHNLRSTGVRTADIYRRIARVVTGLKSLPVHLPRQWSEYHYRNFLTFFATPREFSNLRWVVEFEGDIKCARFDFLSSEDSEVDLQSFSPKPWLPSFDVLVQRLLEVEVSEKAQQAASPMAQEFDLSAIGSASIVEGRTYEEWQRHLTEPQAQLLDIAFEKPVRIVGPAGSGKTLALCMRALKLSRDSEVVAQGRRILVATHSWAMSERIDGVLTALNAGSAPGFITVFPLLSLLEIHAGHIGQHKTDVIGDDSTDGRRKAIEIIANIISRLDVRGRLNISTWISESLAAAPDSRARLDLNINVYEEISGVLTASGVAPDDSESIQNYLGASREEWMPPFDSVHDRAFVIEIYKRFLQDLIDRGAITTDQFILDSIRVLETFTWRMRKETEGYDYIFVDELQLFDPQERASLELLGRSRSGVPFNTAEDPSQGVFSSLNAHRISYKNEPVYLDTVHRFNREIFDFIYFLYQKFQLNALPLNVHNEREAGAERPRLYITENQQSAIIKATEICKDLDIHSSSDQRVCVVTLGDVDTQIYANLIKARLQVTQLTSFDDVEQLSYSRRSVVVSPWEFIGGTQFAHVVVLAAGISNPRSQFARLREMISIYLSSSRAADTLHIVCAAYVPAILEEAREQGVLQAISQGQR